MDKLLNLLAAIQDENWRYTTHVAPIEEDGWDFYVNCSAYIDQESEHKGALHFDHEPVIEVLNDFSGYGYHSYVREAVSPLGVDIDGVVKHEVEIRVKA